MAHYDQWPFIVDSKNVQTKVLGTSFNISSYPETDFINIALVEGSVEVNTPNNPAFILEPMKMAKIKSDLRSIEVDQFEFKKIAGWKDNFIVFEKSSFDEVQSTLERWYDVKFVCNRTPYFDGGYTGEFADQSLDAVLAGMSSGKFTYRIEGKNIIIN
ncbi:MAG: DUF4974 domain-containing protein [Cyclobacteriaceae bacterium]|nr:DUF4974 domain-containing protein [Cyclobacteriaceae bacterium]